MGEELSESEAASARDALEEEFEKIKIEFAKRIDHFEHQHFEPRLEEMFEQFSRNNPAYVPVFNGHGLIEGLIDELLSESVKHPNSLHENYTFAQRLNILQSVSPLPSTSLIWRLLAKLNALRNAVAHRSNPEKLLKLLREIQAIIRESKLRTPNEENKPDWVIGYAFAMASFDLDLLITTTRLRNRVKRLLDKLGWKHPLSLKTFSLLQILEEAMTRDIV
jgi:hypothetical protein